MTPDAGQLNARILIVDDNRMNVTLLEQTLGSAGYTCVTSTLDPTAVCGLHVKNQYDLILLDLQMPGMDGFEVMERLKLVETDGYLPILVVTAQPDHKLRALRAGAKDFLSKPLDIAEVLTRVHNMLEVRLLHVALRQKNDRIGNGCSMKLSRSAKCRSDSRCTCRRIRSPRGCRRAPMSLRTALPK